MSGKQIPLDYDRATKLRMLERVNIPLEAGRKTSQLAMKAVLKVIDAHARDKPSAILKLSTIAAEAGQSRDATKRALKELERQFLVAVTRRTAGTGKRASEYRVGWLNLEALVEAQQAPSDGARGPDRWCTGHHPTVHGAPSYKAPSAKRQEEPSGVKRYEDGNSSFEESKADRARFLLRRWATVLTPRGADRGNLAKVAYLVATGALAEGDVERVLRSMIDPDRKEPIKVPPMGYFLRALRKNLKELKIDLSALMRSVQADHALQALR